MPTTIFVAVLFTACNPAPTAPEAEEANKEVEAPADPPLAPQPDAAEKAQGLVPSIIETQAALKNSGIDTELATLIAPRTYDLTLDATDRAAVRTGVVLADMLLTVKKSEKAKLKEQLGTIRIGMTQLEGGSDIDRTLADFEESVEADSVTREELLAELDQISGAIIPELEFNGNERVVPLITAGSWLEGTHLVARALSAVPAEKRTDADKILKAPEVVDYFQKYVAEEGAEKASEPVAAQLKATLAELEGLAGKAEPLTDDELKTVAKTTGDVLSLL